MDLLRDVDSVERSSVTDYLTQHESGLWVLAAPRECLQWRSVTADRFRKVIGVLARRFDVVLVDTAGALGDLSLAALEEANMVLWVTSSDFSSINNSLIALETLQQLSYPETRIRLMLNVTSVDDGVRPARIEEVLGRQFFWLVPYDRELRFGAQVGRPAVTTRKDSRGAQSIIQLAQALVGVSPKVNGKTASPLRRWFSRGASTNGDSPKAAARGEVIGNAETH
jgi:pilus assembly protein CpaE